MAHHEKILFREREGRPRANVFSAEKVCTFFHQENHEPRTIPALEKQMFESYDVIRNDSTSLSAVEYGTRKNPAHTANKIRNSLEPLLYWGLLLAIAAGITAALLYLYLPQFVSLVITTAIPVFMAGIRHDALSLVNIFQMKSEFFLSALPLIIAVITVLAVILLVRGRNLSHTKKRIRH